MAANVLPRFHLLMGPESSSQSLNPFDLCISFLGPSDVNELIVLILKTPPPNAIESLARRSNYFRRRIQVGTSN